MPNQNILVSRNPNEDEVNHALGTLVQFARSRSAAQLVFGFDVATELGNQESWEIDIRESSSKPLPLPENN